MFQDLPEEWEEEASSCYVMSNTVCNGNFKN